MALVEGKPHVFLANFSGLKSDQVAVQTPVKDIKIRFRANAAAKVFYLPFLGEKKQLKARFRDGEVMCTLPIFEKGGVVWLEE